jgi:N-acetylneuraminate lyase
MQFEKIKGLIVAPFTPFDKKGEVDLNPIDNYASMLQKNGLIGVF